MPTRIEEWDQRYRTGEQAFEAPSPLVVEHARGLKPGSALDLASGPGRNGLYLAGRGWRVRAVDGSPVAIQILRARATERQLAIDARVADLEAGNLEVEPGNFDLVLSCCYFQRSLIPTIKSALRPGGLAIVIAHVADADRPTPTRAYPGELPALFHGWGILHYREGEPGESCHRHGVAELVAQKPA
jgi:tellurite methyltransferase